MVKTWVNKYWVRPQDLLPDTGAAIKVVAVVGHSGRDWAAYYGESDQSDNEIASNGDKLDKNAAKLLFPTFAAVLEYRE